MKSYPLIQGDKIKSLKIDENGPTGLIKSGSSKYKGETLDILLPNGKIQRVTFGINVILGKVAITTETLHNHKGEDYVNKMLDMAAYENQWE